jgi:hypothetical protein
VAAILTMKLHDCRQIEREAATGNIMYFYAGRYSRVEAVGAPGPLCHAMPCSSPERSSTVIRNVYSNQGHLQSLYKYSILPS